MDAVGRYELVAELASGESGVVYRARDPLLGRDVTVLLFPRGADGDFGEKTLARFCKHPGIVDIHDAGVHDGRPYHVLEYVDGRSVAQMIGGGVRITTDAALSMAESLARALGYMHVRGVQHNAVSPDNVVVRTGGKPVLVDFRHAGPGEGPSIGVDDIAGVGRTLLCALTGTLRDGTLEDLAEVAPAYVVDVVRRCCDGRFLDAEGLARSLHAIVEALDHSATPTHAVIPKAGETLLLHAENCEVDRPASYREYHIEEHLSAGGFGDVYRAIDRVSGHCVAIKVLKRHLLADPDAVARFRREADVLACLQHPNIVRIFNYGRCGASVFIAMELVDGKTLDAIRREEPTMSVERAAKLMVPVLRALSVLADAGIVHRDVKPTNVKVADDRVVLLDFGIVRVEGWETLTQNAAFIGTLRYASPEQLSGTVITPASDVYAAGVMLYELLSGKSPYSATSVASLMMKVTKAAPTSIEEHRDDLPAEVVALIDRMLSRDPTARPDAASAAQDLAPLCETIVSTR